MEKEECTDIFLSSHPTSFFLCLAHEPVVKGLSAPGTQMTLWICDVTES